MKHLVGFRIFESSGSGLTQEQEEFLNEHTKDNWKYDPTTGLVDVEGDFDCSLSGIPNFKGVKFGKVSGKFDCSNNKLLSLEGSPQECGFMFDCSANGLKSLEGAPSKCGGDFDCSNNRLTSLKGAPKQVGGSYYCRYNQLTTLEGVPREVKGNFDCSNNRLTSLKGAPQKCGDDFDCRNNQITTLEGAPKECGGYFNCSWNHLTSLKGAPQKVGWRFDCSYNKLTSLEGAPWEVGGDFFCDAFALNEEEWNPERWLKILKSNVSPETHSLILSLLSPDNLNQEIQKDPAGMVMKLKGIWNSPDFAATRAKLVWPKGYEEEMGIVGDISTIGF